MKTLVSILITTLSLYAANSASAQTVYSQHYSPTAGVEYDTITTSGCSNCQILDPQEAADTGTSQASRIMVQGSAQDEATLYLKLTDTVATGGNAGVALIRSGSANATVLSAMKLIAYRNGTAVDSASGNSISTYTVNSNTGLIAVEFTPSVTFDAVSISLKKLGSGVNWADIYFAYGNNPAPLPVELSKFEAVKESGKVVIRWETASEHNNSHFLVQKSINGTDFETIDNKDGYVNSTNIKRYLSQDVYPQIGYNYYRLVQVDLDGTTTYSKQVVVNFNNGYMNNVKANVYPNPVVNAVNVSFSSPIAGAEIKLGDMMGNILKSEFMSSESTKVSLDMTSVSAGTYMVYVFAKDGTLVYKQLIVKSH